MITYQDPSMFSGSRGATLAAVALLHMVAACGFYFGLAQPILQHLVPPPITVDNIPRPRDKLAVQTGAPQFDHARLRYDPPENPSFPAHSETQVTVERGPTESASGTGTGPVHETTAARIDPKHPLHIGPDYYPVGAIRREQEGRCVVQVTVAADGRITSATLHTSSGFALLDDACLSAVRGQHMLPATQDGKPIESSVPLPILWKLTGSR